MNCVDKEVIQDDMSVDCKFKAYELVCQGLKITNDSVLSIDTHEIGGKDLFKNDDQHPQYYSDIYFTYSDIYFVLENINVMDWAEQAQLFLLAVQAQYILAHLLDYRCESFKHEDHVSRFSEGSGQPPLNSTPRSSRTWVPPHPVIQARSSYCEDSSDQLIEGSTPEGTNRHRREGQQHTADGKRGQRHETSQPNRRQQLQTVEQVRNGGNEQPQPQNGPEQAHNLNETDARDGQVASSFTRTYERRRVHHEDDQERVDIPEDADPTTVLLLKELQKTNRLIQLQGDRIHELERKRRYRSPSRRHHRSRSYSSSPSPPRMHRRRSPSSSRSPPKRYHRQRSYSRSPLRKSKKNQRPKTTETGSLSPERDSRGPSKAVLKPRKRYPPRDNRKSPGRAQVKSQRARHSTSPGPSDEEDFRSPLSEEMRRARLPRGMEKPPTLDLYDETTDPDDHIRSIEVIMDYPIVRGSIKCRIFPTMLRKGAMTWYRNLPPNSIHSWTELKELFLSHFTASRRQPKSEENLEAVIQSKEPTNPSETTSTGSTKRSSKCRRPIT
ncbi:uncharacterized protein LOC131658197 [Vicia villosa]|uniref:uncharacterized protein LOC131658197 n=1 Tax=Vicia villosa TaxID=3911 RepID=UPI00273A8F6F|nr:uncharacterized protein LOC131658197 [Vicia villosa]